MALLRGLLPENCKQMFAECFLDCYQKSFNLQYQKGVKSFYSSDKRSILLTQFLWKKNTFGESWNKLSAALYCHLAEYDSKLSALRKRKMIWWTFSWKINSIQKSHGEKSSDVSKRRFVFSSCNSVQSYFSASSWV